MSITKQLHVRFGALLLIVLLLLVVIVAAVYRERSTKASAAQAHRKCRRSPTAFVRR